MGDDPRNKEVTAKAGSMKKKWLCTECGYIHEGPEPPEVCPECFAPKEAFREVFEANA